jgi:hypothetical protein
VLFRVYFPPKFLAEVLCFVAHTLQIVEILSRNAFQNLAQVRHGYLGESVVGACVIEVLLEVAHQLTALGFARLLEFDVSVRKKIPNALHMRLFYP